MGKVLVLQSFPQPELGLMMLKPGTKLLGEFSEKLSGNRVLIAPVPEHMAHIPSGVVDESPLVSIQNSLVEDERLLPFFTNEDVNKRLGDDFKFWLERINHCQVSQGDYCHKELTICSYEQGAVRACWTHDNKERENPSEQGKRIAKNNLMVWAIERVTSQLRFDRHHQLTIPELCWWAIRNGVYEQLPSQLLDELFQKETRTVHHHRIKSVEKDDRFMVPPTEQLAKLAKPVLKLDIDDDPPAMYMAKPKPIRWESAKYLAFVRKLPCRVCRKTAGIAHHLIGHGEGRMGSKASDLFVFPLCHDHHQELHRSVDEWEHVHGCQLWHVKETQKKALEVGGLG
ncbi:DUF968 domain-containing protein [Vibrio sp. SCSIO 43136]|uniref:DUF968 domain-containing protein n=1 Tax=Vibrio sp. SCSIO 43136 TaxID=2819101 RepID=UPI002075EEA5|nr:DUF968 domain-containing protein [Vibrio sp. SCSIO 43136]USD68111.1 DUF968 domain-containing protein [Vibrio sp. SCSIO 43136]